MAQEMRSEGNTFTPDRKECPPLWYHSSSKQAVQVDRMTQHSKTSSTPVISPQSLQDEAFIPGEELWLMFGNGSLLPDRWPELENMGRNGRGEPFSEQLSVWATQFFPGENTWLNLSTAFQLWFDATSLLKTMCSVSPYIKPGNSLKTPCIN